MTPRRSPIGEPPTSTVKAINAQGRYKALNLNPQNEMGASGSRRLQTYTIKKMREDARKGKPINVPIPYLIRLYIYVDVIKSTMRLIAPKSSMKA